MNYHFYPTARSVSQALPFMKQLLGIPSIHPDPLSLSFLHYSNAMRGIYLFSAKTALRYFSKSKFLSSGLRMTVSTSVSISFGLLFHVGAVSSIHDMFHVSAFRPRPHVGVVYVLPSPFGGLVFVWNSFLACWIKCSLRSHSRWAAASFACWLKEVCLVRP